MLKLILVFTLTLPFFSAFGKTWTINRDHSEILFLVPYLKVSELTGRFNKFTGHMELDEKSNLPTSLYVEIASGSIDTGNSMRDGHLRGSEFFSSEIYPEITFQSESVKEIKPGSFRATGILKIKNVALTHSFDFTLSEMIKDTWGYDNRMVKFGTILDRTKYNLKWNKTLAGRDYLVGDTINIRGLFQMQPASGLTPKSKHMIPDTAYIRSREKVARGEEVDQGAGAQIVVPEKVVPAVVKEETKVRTEIKRIPPQEKSVLWWINFCVLGMFGFFGVSLSGIYGKKFLLKTYAQKYEETGRLGLISDLVVIALVMMYSYALWFVGWEV